MGTWDRFGMSDDRGYRSGILYGGMIEVWYVQTLDMSGISSQGIIYDLHYMEYYIYGPGISHKGIG